MRVADFVSDTEVRRDPNGAELAHAKPSERWSVWGPDGGHLTAAGMAAGPRSPHADP